MAIGSLCCISICCAALACGPVSVAPLATAAECDHASALTQASDPTAALPQSSAPGVLGLDPVAFFEQLVARYRGLNLYRDTVELIQVTYREGVEASRVQTKLACEVSDGKLTVQTPASQMRSGLKLDLPMKKSPAAKKVSEAQDLWLAPHMALKFEDEPLKKLRAGIDEGFTATDIESVTIDNKSMVHLELRSGDGASQNATARIDLYVNSDSMLIERIEGQQILPDGAEFSTTLHITPEQVEDADAPLSPAAPSSAPQQSQPASDADDNAGAMMMSPAA